MRDQALAFDGALHRNRRNDGRSQKNDSCQDRGKRNYHCYTDRRERNANH